MQNRAVRAAAWALLMTDISGVAYALSARYVLECSQDGKIYNEKGEIVGSFEPDSLGSHGETSVTHPYHWQIGKVSLGGRISLPDGFDEVCGSGTLNTDLRPGATLAWVSPSNGSVQFTIVGRGGEVGFTNPYDGRTSFYSDPIVLEFTDEKPVAQPGAGDAGSPLFDSSGTVVALLLSFDGRRYYAASLAAYAERFQLHTFTKQLRLPTAAHFERISQPYAVKQAKRSGENYRDYGRGKADRTP
jgi:hypothetical protein